MNSTKSNFRTTLQYDFIHPHWNLFEPIDMLYHYTVGIMISIVGMIGTFSNILVLYLFLLSPSLRTSSNILLMNLAVSDLLFSMIVGFPIKTIASFNGKWPWGKRACEIYGFLCGVSGICALMTHAFIAMERYLAICRPSYVKTTEHFVRVYIEVACIWIWGLMWTVLPFFGIGKYMAEGFLTSCTYDYLDDSISSYIFNFGMLIFAFLIPLMIMVFSYSAILRYVMSNRHLRISHDNSRISFQKHGSSSVEEETIHRLIKSQINYKRNIKIVIISLAILVCYLLSWVPYVTITFVALIGYRNFLTPLVAEIPVFFAKSSGIYNPVIYSLLHTKFKRELTQKFPAIQSLLSESRLSIRSYRSNDTRSRSISIRSRELRDRAF